MIYNYMVFFSFLSNKFGVFFSSFFHTSPLFPSSLSAIKREKNQLLDLILKKMMKSLPVVYLASDDSCLFSFSLFSFLSLFLSLF